MMVDYFNREIVGERPAQSLPPFAKDDTGQALPSLKLPLAFLVLGGLLVLAASIYGYFLISFHTNAFERYAAAATINNRAFELTTAIGSLDHAEQRFAETGMDDEFADARQMLHNTMLKLAKALETEQRHDVRHLLGQLALRLDEHHIRMMNSKPDLGGLRDRTLFASLSKEQLLQPLLDLSAMAISNSQEAEADFKHISTNMSFAVASAELGLLISGIALFSFYRRRVGVLAQSRQVLTGDNHRLRKAFDMQSIKLDRVESLFKSSLSASKMTMFIQDNNLAISWIHNPKFGTAESMIGKRDEDFMPREAWLQTVKAKLNVIETGIGAQLEYSYHLNGKTVDKWMQIDPIIENGKVIGIIGVALDVTERRLREAKIEALASELVHRNQNLLAVVAATARRMIQTSSSLAEFERGFSARLQSISRSFDLIVHENWTGASLDDLIQSQITTIDGTLLDRVTLKGAPTTATPQCAEAIGTAIHELTQNALQHGAFTQPNGVVNVDWWVETDLFGTSQLLFVWQENDGTTREPALTNRRFGLGVLENTIPRALGGNANVVTYPGGIKWRMRCPWPDPSNQKAEMVELLSA